MGEEKQNKAGYVQQWLELLSVVTAMQSVHCAVLKNNKASSECICWLIDTPEGPIVLQASKSGSTQWCTQHTDKNSLLNEHVISAL